MRESPLSSDPPNAQFLRSFGERVRGMRARRGMSRRLLATHAGISERYVTQVESGKGNVSILILRQMAAALGLPLSELLVEMDQGSELSMLHDQLSRLSPSQMRQARDTLVRQFEGEADASRNQRIALIGLRGAGKTTLGRAAGEELGVPFFELDREIERRSGTALGSILELYGQHAYRRYELEALEELLVNYPRFIVATGGSLVSESTTYELLLRSCFCVWVSTSPEEHMARVIAQGDRRPMAGSAQAMDDLRRILEERTPLYARADATLNTAGENVEESVRRLVAVIRA